MKSVKKKSAVVYLLIIFIAAVFFFGGVYYSNLSKTNTNQEESILIFNETGNSSTTELVVSNQTITEELTPVENKINNPPITKEDYQALLGKLDYEIAYNLLLTKYTNETNYIYSKVNNSADPITDSLYFLEGEKGIVYGSDESNYGIKNYWASPNETLKKLRGDDEDFALLLNALVDNFKNSNTTCFLVGNADFTGLFCYTIQYSIKYQKKVITGYRLEGFYYDNWFTEAGQAWYSTENVKIDEDQKEQDKRIVIRSFIKDFMENAVGYCCTDNWKIKVTEETEDSITFLYNKNNFYTLTDRKSFEDFIYNIVK